MGLFEKKEKGPFEMNFLESVGFGIRNFFCDPHYSNVGEMSSDMAAKTAAVRTESQKVQDLWNTYKSCSECGLSQPPENNFCTNCGHKMGGKLREAVIHHADNDPEPPHALRTGEVPVPSDVEAWTEDHQPVSEVRAEGSPPPNDVPTLSAPTTEEARA